jgi:hypothetical protein
VSGLFPSGFLSKMLHKFSASPCMLHALTITLLDCIALITVCEEQKLRWFSFHSFTLPPITLSLLGPNVLTTLFSDTLNPPPNVRGQVSNPHKTASYIMVLYF